MIEELDRMVDAIGARQSKLVLIVGSPKAGKSALLRALGEHRGVTPLLVGAALGTRLSAVPQKQRHLQVGTILNELANQHAKDEVSLMDNIELLFDRSLRLDPLDLLKQHAHVRRVVAVWPGESYGGRLTYADMGHPEHQNYGLEGIVTFEIRQ